jgi:WXXGXW repeat (2 copies)
VSFGRSVAIAALPLVVGCYVEAGQAPPPYGPNEVVVADPPPPPPPPPEPAPPPAPAGQVWVAGYHRWDGHKYVYERGHYERPPHSNARYVPGHWEARGQGKVWVNAHWG